MGRSKSIKETGMIRPEERENVAYRLLHKVSLSVK